MIDKEKLEIVLAAAEMRARELLGQASKYAALATEYDREMGTGQQAIADETLEQHFRPLQDAIDAVRASVGEMDALCEEAAEISRYGPRDD